MPVLNERENLPVFCQRIALLACADELRLIFVDNGSSDGSLDFLRTIKNAMIIEHTHNEGYGASLRDGINAAQGDFIVIIDADCEYAPEIIPRLIAELRQGKPVVYASRFLQGDCANVDAMPRFKVLGNRIISQLFNFLFHQRVTDLYTGCKALRRECVRGMHMKRNGFEQVLEIAVLLTQQGCRIDEVPVVFAPRSSGVSKMSHIVETAKYLFWLLFYRLKFIRPPVRKV